MTAASPPARPSRAPYVLAAALFGVALLIVAVLAVIFIRAISGYTVTPVEPGEPTPACSATDASGQGANRAAMTPTLTVTDGGRTWQRSTTIDGPPGTYTLICEAASGAEFGYGPSPRVGRYVLMGVVGGGAAGILTLAAFMIFLLTILGRRNRRAAVA